ncbi:MAG: hypothetical protein JWN96_2867 [Mycobacterium sp.]|nr:hypothetical protein [Mycobacterium sp.]
MSESPFRFYRGAAALMAADLATTPSTGLRSQLCGDAHMLNFRLLASAERRLIFDINDFDETLPGPWEWDVKRLAASLVIAGRANGFGRRTRREIVVACVAAYREWMRHFAAMPTLDVWHTKADMDEIRSVVAQNLQKRGRKQLSDSLKTARRRDNRQAIKKLTTVEGTRLRIASDPPLLVRLEDLVDGDPVDVQARLASLVHRYAKSLPADRRHLIEQYRIVDMARKVVGVGSVGTSCWIILLVGRNDDDALLLQVKEASESVLEPFAGASVFSHHGERVVIGQRLMQASSDISWDGCGLRVSMASCATSTSGSCVIGKALPCLKKWCLSACDGSASSPEPRWLGRMRSPATGWRLLPTLAVPTPLTTHSPSSRSPTPIRTNRTRIGWCRPSPKGVSALRVGDAWNCRSGRDRRPSLCGEGRGFRTFIRRWPGMTGTQLRCGPAVRSG